MTQFSFRTILVLASLTSLLGLAPTARAATQVHSLGEMAGTIKNPAGRENFAEQMNGSPLPPDNLGTHLPSGLSAATVAALIAPGEDVHLATLIGAKAWSHRPNSYVAIACFAEDSKDSDLKNAAASPSCDSSAGAKDVFLGVIEQPPGGTPRLVARYPRALDVTFSWADSNLHAPVSAGDTDLQPEVWSRFDFAPYKIHDDGYAFGLRAGINEGYAGGGAYFEALQLFEIKGAQLQAVFSQPLYFQGNYAGEWHDDGTRDHSEEEANSTLAVLPAVHAGYHDLQVNNRDTSWHKVFEWSPTAGRYMARACPGLGFSASFNGKVGDSIPVVTTLVKNASCSVEGSYVLSEPTRTVKGTLDGCHFSSRNALVCTWHDVYGSGQVNMDFLGEDHQQFNGDYTAIGNPSNKGSWDGERGHH